MPHRELIDLGIAREFLGRSFAPNETIGILLRQACPAMIVQRIVTLKHALQPGYLAWLAHDNAAGANVYVSANPLVSESRKRTKESIAEVRHLYLDLDQVLWRVESIPFEQQESLLKLLAITFGGDPACTDCNRVLRLPGFLNQKYAPAHLVTVEYPTLSLSHSEDFNLPYPIPSRELIRGPIGPLKPMEKHSHSESDWAWILGELARGKDPLKLTRMLAERRSDKSNPVYYATRTVDVASAWLWLRDGLPIADVVTMLQVRRRFQIPDKLCSARAHEIAFTAQRMIARKKIA
jgi:hypothetical protein